MTLRTFDVERAILCDYASIDINGKAFAMGIVASEIYVPGGATQSIPFFILLTLIPKQATFKAVVQARNPQGVVFFEANCLYQKIRAPSFSERCNFILQLPTTKFQGYGRYIMNISDGGREYGSLFLDVKEGWSIPQDVGQIAIQIVNPT